VLLAMASTVCIDAGAESTAEFDDAAARMQYAYYTSDPRALEEVLTLVAGFDTEVGYEAVKPYQLAYGNWKLAQLYGEPQEDRSKPSTRSAASKAAKNCVRSAQEAIAKDPRMAEVYAIEAACDGFAPGTPGGGSSSCARSKSLRTATTLAPDNPRVQLVGALCSSSAAGEVPATTELWRAVVETFETAPPSQPGRPDWGHAEALTLLGESYLQRGDMVAARDVLERALVLAPDFRHAQKLLQAAATRPR
jgi:tetratricopeptide (TPR) repeat protein